MRQRQYNPFAPLSPRAQSRQANQFVSAQIGPLIKALNAQFARQNQAGQSAISTGTNQLAQSLAPMARQTHQIYQTAQNQERGDITALANRLNSVGGQVAGQVGQQQQAAGIGSGGIDLNKIGAGASNAGFSMGSSGLAQLISQGAAQENYSAQLPGIARLGGAQKSSNFRQQLESERFKGVSDL